MKLRRFTTVLVGIGLGLVLVRDAAATLVVDDNGADCPGAEYHTIGAALADALDGDDIQVCPGTYTEQLVISKRIRLGGRIIGPRRPLLRPASLPVRRESVLDGRDFVAGIVVDARPAVIEALDLDLSDNDVSGCDVVLAGILFRNASGIVSDVTGDDPILTGKIALAHLRELPDYYTRLAVMEGESE